MAVQTVKVIINGQEVVLTWNGTSSKYEGTISAPSKSSNRIKTDTLVGVVSGANVTLTLTASSDQDKNFATVFKDGVPLADTAWNFLSATSISVLTTAVTAGYKVEYRALVAVDGGTGGKYNAYIEATDTAGNVSKKSFDTGVLLTAVAVRETTLPVISGLSPAASAKSNTSVPILSGSFTDADSGIATSTFKLTITKSDATILNVVPGSPGLTLTVGTFSYTPQVALPEGTTSYVVEISDNDANKQTSASTSFTIDTIAPALNVSAPTNAAVTNNASCTVSGTTETSAVVTIKLNGADQGAITNTADAFSKVITLASGLNTIITVATDAAGNHTDVTRTITLDTVPPNITLIEITPNPATGGATLTIKVTVLD